MTVIRLNFIPVLIVLQQNSSDLLEACMKNAALQIKRTSLSEVNVLNNTEINIAKRNMRHAEKKQRQD